MISVVDGLTIPPERDLPAAALVARKQLLLAAVVAEPASLAERIQLRLRTILGLFVMLSVLLALAVTCTVMTANGGAAKRAVELTAATTAVTAVALSAPAVAKPAADRHLRLLMVGHQPRQFASG